MGETRDDGGFDLRSKTEFVRMWSQQIDRGGEDTVRQAARAFEAVGFVRGQHVGADPVLMTPRTTLEWYAGQLIDMAETGAWFGINSWINCTDKFAPKPLPLHPPAETEQKHG